MFLFGAIAAMSSLFSSMSPNENVWLSVDNVGGQVSGSVSNIELGKNRRWTFTDVAVENSLKIKMNSDLHLIYVEDINSSINFATPVAKYGFKAIYQVNASELDLIKKLNLFFHEVDFSNSSSNYASQVSSSESVLVPEIVLKSPVEIDNSRLLSSLKILSGMVPVPGEPSSATIINRSVDTYKVLTQKYLISTLSALGFQTEKKCYTLGRNSGCNIEATHWGQSTKEAIYFSAHYDSVTSSASDDNGSGTAGLLEIAAAVADKSFEKTIRFVFFDQEELGLIGSKAYVQALVPDSNAYPQAVFNLDMIGYDANNDGAIHSVDCGRADSKPLTVALVQNITFAKTNLWISDTCTNRSDHASFWTKNIGSIIVAENFFGGDGNSCYHASCDTISKMNLDYYYRIVKTMTNIAFNLAKPL